MQTPRDLERAIKDYFGISEEHTNGRITVTMLGVTYELARAHLQRKQLGDRPTLDKELAHTPSSLEGKSYMDVLLGIGLAEQEGGEYLVTDKGMQLYSALVRSKYYPHVSSA